MSQLLARPLMGYGPIDIGMDKACVDVYNLGGDRLQGAFIIVL